jgi:hypothetical protein
MQRQKFLPIEDLIATLTEGASIRTGVSMSTADRLMRAENLAADVPHGGD